MRYSFRTHHAQAGDTTTQLVPIIDMKHMHTASRLCKKYSIVLIALSGGGGL